MYDGKNNEPSSKRNLDIFAVKLNLEDDANFFKKFINSRKISKEFTKNDIESSTKVLENREGNEKIDLVNDKIDQTQKLTPNTSLRKLITSEKFDISLQKQKGIIKRFFDLTQKSSLFKKMSTKNEDKIHEIFGDQAHYLNFPKIKIQGYISKYIKKPDFIKRLEKKLTEFHQKHNLIIHPYHKFKVFWDLIHFFLMIFLFFYLPLDIIFEFDASRNIRFGLCGLMLFDNFLGFSTAYFYHGKLITDRKKIFKAYISGFLLDLITQMSLIYDVPNADDTNVSRKFIKLIFLVQYRKFKQIYNTLIDAFKIDLKFGYFLDFINLLAASICIMHWVACAWYFIGTISGETKFWLQIQDINLKPEFDRYLHAFYWSAVTMMTVGYGDITPQNRYETIFATIIVIIGCGLFAYYISSVGFLLQEINKNSYIYKNALKTINHLMEKNNIKMDLRLRIKEYLRFIWKEEKTQLDEEENRIISALPVPLKHEFLLASYGHILIENPMFFVNFSKRTLKETISEGLLKQLQFTPGDVIFDENEADLNPSIYFILKGEVEIYHNKSIRTNECIKLATLRNGNSFGELSFFSGSKRIASAKSTDFTTLFSLNRYDFLHILQNHSDDLEKFYMIQDKIYFSSKNNALRMKCYLCQSSKHLVNKCHFLHFNPDYEKIIKFDQFSLSQDRKYSSRSKSKKTRFKIYKPLETQKSTYFTIRPKGFIDDESSSDDSESKKSDENEKIASEDIITKDNDSQDQNLSNNQNLPSFFINNIKLNNDKNQTETTNITQKRVSIPKYKKKIVTSIFTEAIKAQRKQSNNPPELNPEHKIQLIPEVYSPISSPHQRQSKAYLKESGISNPSEDLDRIFQFKKYFPKANFSNISTIYNENCPFLSIPRRKKQELSRISQYTFDFNTMYNELRKIHNRLKSQKTMRKTKIHNSCKISGFPSNISEEKRLINENKNFKYSLTEVVEIVMKKLREKKKNKWILCRPFLNLLKKFK